MQRPEAHLTNRKRRVLTTAADSRGQESAWELNEMTTPQHTLLHLTADRRRSTGESHQSLLPLLPEDGSALSIPDARRLEQAELEADLFLTLGSMGGFSVHPMGIVRLRPRPDQLTIQLLHEPYVVWYWADLLLPRINDEAGHPRDRVSGIPGLRWRVVGKTVQLYRPDMPTRIVLTGSNVRWWRHVTRRMEADYPTLVRHPGWTPHERAAYEAPGPHPYPPARLFSPLLRRLRATAGTQPLNSTDAWSSGDAWRLEATDGPSCPDLVRLLGHGPTAMGWTVSHKSCTCPCDHEHGSCTIDFHDPRTGASIYYTNGRWRRTLTLRHLQRTRELNTAALT
ncbi:hypothetical protein [Streptomyces sp. VRA16 Mangrove soil]|uniref:hypothetical protein n=1 Tax=Streptomyces sp. VRA16 Mangrove soil TaxID=2817434 RepID=UPI001A9DF5EC|nr:hypothetical protein [Streptomyces sp. VRA16 Mangrove soil]MBO1332560.1 hypothetical protein [Streptomyces sp. VRA16 Mangrove soil]